MSAAKRPSVVRAEAAWRNLGQSIRSLTPSQLVRLALVLGATAFLLWLTTSTWPALAPFAVGGVVAYALLPVVNWLDRFLPRTIAILLVLVAVLGGLFLFFIELVPLLSMQLSFIYRNLPSQAELQEMAVRLDAYIKDLPLPIQATIREILQVAVESSRTRLDTGIRQMVNLGLGGLFSLLNTVGFVLGFLVIPAWLLDVLRDHQTGLRTVNRLIPSFMRRDFWAVMRLIDRPFRAFFEGQVILAIASGVGIYLGALLLETLGWEQFRYKAVIAVLVGLFQLIPVVGPIIAAVVLFMLALVRGIDTAVAVVLIHIIVQWTVNSFVAPRIERRYIDIHPAVLVMVIVALSEFGWIWVLAAAPITAVGRDLFRYAYGRLSDPPLPAGVLPGRLPQVLPDSRLFSPFIPVQPPASPPAETPVPIAYRRNRAMRQSRPSNTNR